MDDEPYSGLWILAFMGAFVPTHDFLCTKGASTLFGAKPLSEGGISGNARICCLMEIAKKVYKLTKCCIFM
jgi:hypothetical protein